MEIGVTDSAADAAAVILVSVVFEDFTGVVLERSVIKLVAGIMPDVAVLS